ncbi:MULTISPECIES: TetR/AcrR family transcriptional regulator [Ktedonobacter]|uniref:TetR family transcriptional regulator n=1 Tax=Ktedonobacter robiniae TaxID=2778365 RepID=A0ABQ3UTL9_9CHLR|nr:MULTISPECIES: TetR/AcrR family transcriptional regulator [Ktedonobacter]GHO56113.1 TetR family transcriptional regulator [Ktedonobacter robiniae]GHO64643.1 TetR family transcriptional regulator [Ktedonobacter sp. SOSP1-52]
MTQQAKKLESFTPGRRRSDQAHRAILQAAREVLEQVGYRAMTIEAIAERAGVGKKTIYRWWPSKAAVALEALTSHTEVQVLFSDTGSLEGDLLAYFELSFSGLRGKSGTVLSGLAAEAQLDPEFAREFQRTFIVPRKQELVALLQRGVQRGELAPDTNLEVLADLIYGAKWYRFLLYPAPLDDAFAREIVKLILRLRSEA